MTAVADAEEGAGGRGAPTLGGGDADVRMAV